MREKVIGFSELTDSREMLEAKPPAIMSLFIYLVLAIFVAAFLWMWFGKIEIVVKAGGVIRPVQNISVVRNIASGEIEELYFSSEDYVEMGDLLFSIDTGPLSVEKESFDRELSEVQLELSGYQMLQASITNGSKTISEENIRFYNKYLQYRFQKEQLKLSLMKAENLYRKESELPADMVADAKLQELKSEFLFAELALKAFESETLLSMEEQIILLEKNKNILNDQLRKINFSLENCLVRAPISGKIQEIESFNPGDYISSGIEILKIIPGGEVNLKAELLIPNKDIVNIKEGARIRYSFASLPHREYGFLSGTVIKIPGDISITTGGMEGVFIVEGDLDNVILVNKKNQAAEVRIGMFFESRIVVREQRILDYILEKLDFLS
jgi:multidrug resistance efflux pump